MCYQNTYIYILVLGEESAYCSALTNHLVELPALCGALPPSSLDPWAHAALSAVHAVYGRAHADVPAVPAGPCGPKKTQENPVGVCPDNQKPKVAQGIVVKTCSVIQLMKTFSYIQDIFTLKVLQHIDTTDILTFAWFMCPRIHQQEVRINYECVITRLIYQVRCIMAVNGYKQTDKDKNILILAFLWGGGYKMYMKIVIKFWSVVTSLCVNGLWPVPVVSDAPSLSWLCPPPTDASCGRSLSLFLCLWALNVSLLQTQKRHFQTRHIQLQNITVSMTTMSYRAAVPHLLQLSDYDDVFYLFSFPPFCGEISLSLLSAVGAWLQVIHLHRPCNLKYVTL